MKSTPLTALCGSSVMVMRAPDAAPNSRHIVTCSSLGHRSVRCADPDIHAELRTHQQQRVGHIVAAVPDEGKSDVGQRLRAVFGHREDVGQHLRRVEFIGEPVEHRHPGVFREFLDDAPGRRRGTRSRRTSGPVPGRCPSSTPCARSATTRVDVGDVGTLVVRRHLERAARAGGGLLEDQRDVLARQALPAQAGVLRALEIPGEVEQVEQVADRCDGPG